jgi:O6-methylguanine-DNA--protein-cysteine methyltransferase
MTSERRQQRQFTSAVPGMSVSDMRRCLAEVRALLQQQDAGNPFDMQFKLSNGQEVWQFVHQVATGLHDKRTHNRRRAALRVDVATHRDDAA